MKRAGLPLQARGFTNPIIQEKLEEYKRQDLDPIQKLLDYNGIPVPTS